MITFFKNQKDLAESLKKAIDEYWSLNLTEGEFINYIEEVYNKNKDKIISNNSITAIIRQRLGKKRILLLVKILDLDIIEEES